MTIDIKMDNQTKLFVALVAGASAILTALIAAIVGVFISINGTKDSKNIVEFQYIDLAMNILRTPPIDDPTDDRVLIRKWAALILKSSSPVGVDEKSLSYEPGSFREGLVERRLNVQTDNQVFNRNYMSQPDIFRSISYYEKTELYNCLNEPLESFTLSFKSLDIIHEKFNLNNDVNITSEHVKKYFNEHCRSK